MRKYYEEPDFMAVIFESSDVIMVSEEAGKRVQKAGNKNEKENDLCSAGYFGLCHAGNWMQ